MYLLDRLWRGNITPSDRYVRPDSEYKKTSKAFCDAIDRLLEVLPPEGKEYWNEVDRLKSNMVMLAEEDVFIYGFRLGARMMLDVVGDYKGQFYEAGEAG